MTITRQHRLFFHFLLLFFLSFTLHASNVSAEGQQKPVTDRLLRELHLDRRFHKCIAVADGDTITLEDLGTVRLIGVDTPEKNHPMLPVQFMAEEASTFMKKLCLGKKIRLEYDPFDEDKRGHYGRILAYPYLEDGTLVQKQLLLNGHAICYTKYPFAETRRQQFRVWEQKAQKKERGLWKKGGMGEILWILEKRQLPIQIEEVSSDAYRLRLGNRVSEPIKRGDLSFHLTALYGWAYALGPGDLKARLKQSGYRKETVPENTPHNSITVIGMAHKKWGILCGNNAKPRVPAEEIEAQVRFLFKWMSASRSQPLDTILSREGYRPVPEKLMAALNPDEMAAAFLEAEPTGVGDGNIISWESAGNYVDKQVTVQGKIVRSFNSGEACFLNFHRNFTRYMSIVIFKNRFHRFPPHPEAFYLNKTIRVKGKIKIYEGRPEMIIENPRQIEMITPKP